MRVHNVKDNHWKLQLLKEMQRIRSFELELYKQYDKKKVRGTLHICLGQEAVAVGACSALGPGDFVTSTHRGHGHFLAAGGSMKHMMAELFGRRDGYCQGKGGTQHMASLEDGFLVSNGITGGGIPYSTGMALAMKMRGLDNVVVCFFGDGASNQGTFHESLNMASIWQLPIIYLIENNRYAMSSRVEDMVATKALVDRAVAYGIPGIAMDGNDVLSVYRAIGEAVVHAKSRRGPVLLEAHTYRMSGHSRSDRCQYRSREEESAWKEKCPIARLRLALREEGIASDDTFLALDSEVASEVAAAVEFGNSSGYLTKDELLDHACC